MFKKYYISFIGLMFSFSLLAQANSETLKELTTQAEKHYDSGQYNEAIALYEKARLEGKNSSFILYNLGNSYYRLGEKGKAMAAYLAARKISPRDPDIKHNLNLIHKEIKDKLDIEVSSKVASVLYFWSDFITQKELKFLALIFLCLSFIFLVLGKIIKLSPALNKTKTALFSLAFALLVFWQMSTFFEKDWGAISAKEVEVRSGPGSFNTVVFKLHKGAPIMIEEKRKDWVKISLSDSKKGWIEASKLSFF